MLATTQTVRHIRSAFSLVLLSLTILQTTPQSYAQEGSGESSDEMLSKSMMGEVAGQVEKFCKAHRVTTLQLVEFRGTVGTRATADVRQDWLDSLRERGISLRDLDSTRISGSIQTQQEGDAEIILLMCTLSDSRGADIRTFRVRKVISSKPLS